MPSERITLRIDEGDMRIFRHEASKHGVSVSEYLKGLIREGYFYRGIKDVADEVKNTIPNRESEKLNLFESLFEIRNYLRLMVATSSNNRSHVDTAIEKAKESAKELLKH